MIRAFIHPDQVSTYDFFFIDERPWKNQSTPQLASTLTISELVDIIFDMNMKLVEPMMFEFPLIKGDEEQKRQQMIEFLETNTTAELDFSKLLRHPSDNIDDDQFNSVSLKYVSYTRLELFYRVFTYMAIRPLFTKDQLCGSIRDNLLAEREPDKGNWRDGILWIDSDRTPKTLSQLRDIRYESAKTYVYLPRGKKYYAEDSPYRNREFLNKIKTERMNEILIEDLKDGLLY